MISGKTTLIAHLGYPTFAFKAPMIYNPWFEKSDIDAVVVPMGVKAEEFPEFFRYLFKLTNIRGALVTMPHKIVTTELVDELSPIAKVAGAANAVLVREDGSTVGDQFDGAGFVRGVERKGFPLQGKRALVVGNGGVGSPIAASLAGAGVAAMGLFDPNSAASDSLATRLQEQYPQLDLATGSKDPEGYDIVVNATPLGMKDDDPLPMDVDRIAPTTFVGEVVMRQEITPFLHAARERGCPIQVGSDMLFEMIPAYLEFFGFGTATPEELRAVRTDQELIRWDGTACGREELMRDVAGVSAAARVASGVHRLALPLGIHGVPTVSSYLLSGDDGDTLVDCGIAAGATEGGDPGPDGTAALSAALAACGSSLERVERLVVTHAHIDHFGLAGEVVRRSGGELWMHRDTALDLAKYDEPEEAVDRRTLMLADHGLYGPELTETSEGLRDWMPVMPSIGRPTRVLDGDERFTAGGRTWEVVHTPGHSPGHVCLWNAGERLLCSGDHLLQVVSPPVTFERGFETDPMGSYLESLDRVAALGPELVLPGHGSPFRDGARRAEAIARGKRRRLQEIRALVEARERTVTELTAELFRSALTGAQQHFAMAEILAYLAFHEARGAVLRVRRPDGVFLWRAAAAAGSMESGR